MGVGSGDMGQRVGNNWRTTYVGAIVTFLKCPYLTYQSQNVNNGGGCPLGPRIILLAAMVTMEVRFAGQKNGKLSDKRHQTVPCSVHPVSILV